jgi:hypothetical protein
MPLRRKSIPTRTMLEHSIDGRPVPGGYMSLKTLWKRIVQLYGDIMVTIVVVGAPLGALHQLLIVFCQW